MVFFFVKEDFLNKGKLVIEEKPTVSARYIRTNKDYNFRNTIEKYQHEFDNSNLLGGQNGGGYITPYRVSMDRVKYFLSEARHNTRFGLYWYENGETVDLRKKAVGGWLDIKTILEYSETHYASPKQSLAKALTDFENDWCERKKENGKLYFRFRGEPIKDE